MPGGYIGLADQVTTTRHPWNSPCTVQYHPRISVKWWSTHRYHMPVPAFAHLFWLGLPSKLIFICPPFQYPSPYPPHASLSTDCCVTWYPVLPPYWSGIQWKPHRIALIWSWMLLLGWSTGSQHPPNLQPSKWYGGGHLSHHYYRIPTVLVDCCSWLPLP